MQTKKRTSRTTKVMTTETSLRVSVTFPPELYRTLEKVARQKKVSLAWVVRDAAEKYVADLWPLFGRAQ